jgi:hypothetical protein
MEDMISDHKEDIKKFQRESEKGKECSPKKFASQLSLTFAPLRKNN